MRKILFKGYLVDEGGWVTGEYHRYTSEMVVAMCDYAYSVFKVIPESVGQYIGVKDKHGNYIFEGDILEAHTSDYGGDTFTGVVRFKDGCYGIEFDDFFEEGKKGFHRIGKKIKWNDMKASGYMAYTYEVIGNVFESPEPLKESSANNDEWRMKDGTLLLRNRTGTTPATANTKAICSIKAEDVDGK